MNVEELTEYDKRITKLQKEIELIRKDKRKEMLGNAPSKLVGKFFYLGRGESLYVIRVVKALDDDSFQCEGVFIRKSNDPMIEYSKECYLEKYDIENDEITLEQFLATKKEVEDMINLKIPTLTQLQLSWQAL